MQRRRTVVVAQCRVGAVAQQQLHHVLVAAVSRPMQRRGSAWRLRGRTRAIPQEEGAHVQVTPATRVVLRSKVAEEGRQGDTIKESSWRNIYCILRADM